mgnify:FL=1
MWLFQIIAKIFFMEYLKKKPKLVLSIFVIFTIIFFIYKKTYNITTAMVNIQIQEKLKQTLIECGNDGSGISYGVLEKDSLRQMYYIKWIDGFAFAKLFMQVPQNIISLQNTAIFRQPLPIDAKTYENFQRYIPKIENEFFIFHANIKNNLPTSNYINQQAWIETNKKRKLYGIDFLQIAFLNKNDKIYAIFFNQTQHNNEALQTICGENGAQELLQEFIFFLRDDGHIKKNI